MLPALRAVLWCLWLGCQQHADNLKQDADDGQGDADWIHAQLLQHFLLAGPPVALYRQEVVILVFADAKRLAQCPLVGQ